MKYFKLMFILFILPVVAVAQADANKVLCLGQTITLTSTETGSTFHWYKVVNGSAQLQTSTTTKVYTETPTTSGYYNYQVVAENSAGCISPISDVVKIYILPALTASVTTPSSSVCSKPASPFVLTANVPDGFTYAYQWTRNGTLIAGANAKTYTAPGETVAGTVTFAVNVSYSLSTTCAISATKVITVAQELLKPVIGR
ncbi:MAG: hypothetical protein ACRYFA_01190 [Janthinobacterium lividum]